MSNEVEQGQRLPTPLRADISDRLSDGSDCWVIDSEQGSVAEMMCPKDVEESWANHIVTAVNAYAELAALRKDNERLAAEVERLKRGEFICSKCGIRKNSDDVTSEPEF